MNQSDQFNEGLEYAQMLEIPVSTVNVVKKKSPFLRRKKLERDLKGEAIQSVNEKMQEVFTENVGEPLPYAEEAELPPKKALRDKWNVIFVCEAVVACLIATGIFLCNFFMPETAINTFVGNLTAIQTQEKAYNQITLTSPVSQSSDATVEVTEDGVLHFTEKTSVYPLCDGTVASVTQDGEYYTVKLDHTSTFCSVITGLDSVYSTVGESVKGNLPFGYSNGDNEVRISMYDGDVLLNCYTLTGALPVWNS